MGLTLTPEELGRLLQRNPHLRIQEQLNRREAAPAKAPTKRFDSQAEEILYTRHIRPLLIAGKIAPCREHPRFELLPAVTVGGIRYGARHYTPDFLLTWAGGQVQVIEVKGKAVKRLQRDYPLRRQLFLLRYAVPQGWAFLEIPAEDLTRGTFDELSEPLKKTPPDREGEKGPDRAIPENYKPA